MPIVKKKILLFQLNNNIDIALTGGGAADSRSKEPQGFNPVFGLVAHLILIQHRYQIGIIQIETSCAGRPF